MGNAFSDLGFGFLGAQAPPNPNVSGIGGLASTDATDTGAGTGTTGSAATTIPGAQPAPALNLASGVGQILLFPGKTIVSQFVGTGDPLDTSHLPITVLLSAAAWCGLYWYFFQRGGK